jgi:hypothetical protein
MRPGVIRRSAWAQTDRVLIDPLAHVHRSEAAFFLDGEADGLAQLDGEHFGVLHDNRAIDDDLRDSLGWQGIFAKLISGMIGNILRDVAFVGIFQPGIRCRRNRQA